MPQNGPYKKLFLLSTTPFVSNPKSVSIINPKKLYITKYATILDSVYPKTLNLLSMLLFFSSIISLFL